MFALAMFAIALSQKTNELEMALIELPKHKASY